MRIRVEFTIYPFMDGDDFPAYVSNAIDRVREEDLEIELGPFGQVVIGESERVLHALTLATTAALEAGATKVVVNVETADEPAS